MVESASLVEDGAAGPSASSVIVVFPVWRGAPEFGG